MLKCHAERIRLYGTTNIKIDNDDSAALSLIKEFSNYLAFFIREQNTVDATFTPLENKVWFEDSTDCVG